MELDQAVVKNLRTVMREWRGKPTSASNTLEVQLWATARAYVRPRDNLLRYRSSHVQHMQKALAQMNVQLMLVLSDITGETGMQIIRAIVAGEREPRKPSIPPSSLWLISSPNRYPTRPNPSGASPTTRQGMTCARISTR